ncbi:MAG TPA: carboxypeptidase-like regulatory domain-containing protein [Bryobacteraceae bacterium]|jgi:hypothetical protein
MKARITLAVALLACAAALAAGDQKTTIKVNVKNQYDKPVENAAVILDFVGSHQVMKLGKRKPIHWEVKTNQEGTAHFPPVPEGTVQLQVISSRYQTYGEKMEVAGEEKTVDIQLKPPQKQYSAHPPLKPADAPK